MEISLRLKAVADESVGSTIADIGTDHGYVPIYLAKMGRIKKAIACDINKGPLLKAKENIEREGMSEIIETRLGNGLSEIHEGEAETAIISGMGGMLIIDILKQNFNVTKSLNQLVLQPQLDIENVRRYIHSIGFKIINENMIIDDNKFYTIINAVQGNEAYTDNVDYAFGKINIYKKCPVLKRYIEYRLDRLSMVKTELKNADTENALKRSEKINDDINLYREALKRYEML